MRESDIAVSSSGMWIRDVDLPEELIEAHRQGSLVIFVGAGASLGSPSSLPNFRTLTADVAADGNTEVTGEQLDQPDVLLGELEDHQDIDVHRRVAIRIGVPSSEPNRLHKAIVALAAAGPSVRIVTTNYDMHLSTVLRLSGLTINEYMAPALPMGDDFDGLVYLHGCLRQDPGALVLTDVDFGRAYLRDAWATRFLERMFATYTVLFVGYSHNDVVMSYLARGLRPVRPRFLLTSQPDDPNWRRLRIRPVGYPLRNGSHDALVDVIEGWSAQASMGLLAHRQRVAQLVSGPPSQIPEDASYLESVVADGDKVRFFAEYARGADWLSWVAGQPEFRRLFDPSTAPTSSASVLAYWLAEHYVMDEGLTRAALSVVQRAGGRLGPTMWSAIGHQFHLRKGPRPGWLAPWVMLLIENAPEGGRDWLEFALVASRWPQNRETALLLFSHLTELRLELRQTFGRDDETRFDVRLRGDDYWLREAWTKVFVPHLVEAAREVLVIAERQLRRARQLLTAAGAIGPRWDPLSFRRSAIEPHAQDDIRGSGDVIIDAARDCLQALLDNRSEIALAYLQTWAIAEAPLLRRLAVHGWAYRSDIDATAKLMWLRDQGWLFDHQLHHEVYHLIATTLADAHSDVADALVSDAVAGPDHDAEHRDYEIFNALAWIARHAPNLQSARDALDQVRAEHADFEERVHLDLLSSIETGFVQPRPPMTAEALHQLIENDAAEAIVELRRYEGVISPFNGSSWDDAIGVFVETVRMWPQDGFAVLDVQGELPAGILAGLIRGWARATVDDDTAESITSRLASLDLSPVVDEVASLLADGGRDEATPTEWHRIAAARQLAVVLWSVIDGDTIRPETQNWLERAINHPAGRIAQFWLHAIASDWREAGDSWSGLPLAIREQVDALLEGGGTPSEMAEVVFASQLHFFFVADRAWCATRVLPLLDWANPVRARRAWDGFLIWGRSNNQLLAAGLLDQYLAAAAHREEFTGELRRQLWQHLARVAVYSEVDPIGTGWLRTFTTTVDIAARTQWMDQVGWLLAALPADAVELHWGRWIRQYWNDRLESVPIQLTDKEASAMAQWVVFLTDSISDGVALATRHSAGIEQHSDLLRELTGERIARAPAEFAVLLAHLLKGTQTPFYDCYSLEKVVGLLRAEPRDVNVTVIVEQAVRLGCNDATRW